MKIHKNNASSLDLSFPFLMENLDVANGTAMANLEVMQCYYRPVREGSARKDPTNGGPTTRDHRCSLPQAPSIWPGLSGDLRWKRLGRHSQEPASLVEENSVSYTRKYAQMLQLEVAEFC